MRRIAINKHQSDLLKLACQHMINELQETDINKLSGKDYAIWRYQVDMYKAMLNLLFND